MKIAQALDKGREILESQGVVSSKLDSLILLCHALSFSKEQVVFNPEMEIKEDIKAAYFDDITRRSQHEPVSHIIGKREFYGEEFIVSRDVLDPRPDSESLIELVLAHIARDKDIDMLEIGVGSGCLIITLLKHYLSAKAWGLDVSKDALKVCLQNVQKHQLENRITLLESNLCVNIAADMQFDLIISNPPYIPRQDIAGLAKDVKDFEPILALDGGVDGLDFYRAIAQQSYPLLKKGGAIALEIGAGQGEDVIEIFSKAGFDFIEAKKDLASIVRALYFVKKA